MGVGLFVGAFPVYGLHLPLCLAIGIPARLDVVSSYLAANVNNPLTGPFIVALEVEIGSMILTGTRAHFDVATARATGVGGLVGQAAVGAGVLGVVLGVVGAAVAWNVTRRRRGSPAALERAADRTMSRFRAAPRSHRAYVRSKLRVDPAGRRIANLGPLGRVLDCGCGRGQLALFLLECGAADSVLGFDWDARKIEIANLAAGEDAEFAVGDLRTRDLGGADTILLVDVLHYLPVDDQDELLRRAARALRPGGRVVVREVDARRWGRGTFTSISERAAIRLGMNRGLGITLRRAADIARTLEAADLVCEIRPDGVLLGNALIVASRAGRT